MKKYGIGTGIFTIIFGLITFLSFKIYFGIKGGNVDDLGIFIVFMTLGLAMLILSFIVGLIAGSITLLFGIITIVRIIKAISSPKVETAHSSETEPKL